MRAGADKGRGSQARAVASRSGQDEGSGRQAREGPVRRVQAQGRSSTVAVQARGEQGLEKSGAGADAVQA